MYERRSGLNYRRLLERLMPEMANRAAGFGAGRGVMMPDAAHCYRYCQTYGQYGDKYSQPSFSALRHCQISARKGGAIRLNSRSDVDHVQLVAAKGSFSVTSEGIPSGVHSTEKKS